MLVPVTTIGGLATGMGAIVNALQPCRSLDSGENPSWGLVTIMPSCVELSSNTLLVERGAQHPCTCRTIKQPDQKQLKCLCFSGKPWSGSAQLTCFSCL